MCLMLEINLYLQAMAKGHAPVEPYRIDMDSKSATSIAASALLERCSL